MRPGPFAAPCCINSELDEIMMPISCSKATISLSSTMSYINMAYLLNRGSVISADKSQIDRFDALRRVVSPQCDKLQTPLSLKQVRKQVGNSAARVTREIRKHAFSNHFVLSICIGCGCSE